MILPALLLTLDKYSSWRAGKVVPLILSAVRTILRNLLKSDLVAELNQTVIDMQRMDSVMAVEPYQQLLWKVELLQLVKEVLPLLGLFHHGPNLIVPLQVLRDGGAQESE